MVGVAQLVERWIVVPVAEGSNPSTHPIPNKSLTIFRPADTVVVLVVVLGQGAHTNGARRDRWLASSYGFEAI